MSSLVPDGWKRCEIGKVSKLQGGYAFKSADSTDFGIRWLKIANVGKGKVNWQDRSYLPADFIKFHPDFLLNKGDCVIALTRPITGGELKVARINLSDTPSLLNQRVARVKPDKSLVNQDFIYSMFRYEEITRKIEITIFGTDPPNVSTKQIEEIKFNFPPLKEQQKIAQILTSVDEVIEKTQAQIDKLKALKTGMMQELLTKGIGHIEFKDSPVGRIPVGWEVETLKELTIQIRDGNYGADYPKASEMLESGIPFLTSTVVGNDQKINIGKLKYISSEKHALLAKAHIKKDDVLFTNRGASVGNVAIVPEILDDSNIGPQLTFLRVDPTKMSSLFLYIALQSGYFKKQLKQLDSGSAMNFFGIGTTEKFIFALPSLSEQAKIAAVINAVFIKLDTLNIKLKQTSLIKKALMQDLLTGTVRVNNEQSNATLAAD